MADQFSRGRHFCLYQRSYSQSVPLQHPGQPFFFHDAALRNLDLPGRQTTGQYCFPPGTRGRIPREAPGSRLSSDTPLFTQRLCRIFPCPSGSVRDRRSGNQSYRQLVRALTRIHGPAGWDPSGPVSENRPGYLYFRQGPDPSRYYYRKTGKRQDGLCPGPALSSAET